MCGILCVRLQALHHVNNWVLSVETVHIYTLTHHALPLKSICRHKQNVLYTVDLSPLCHLQLLLSFWCSFTRSCKLNANILCTNSLVKNTQISLAEKVNGSGREVRWANEKEVERKSKQKNPVSIASHRERERERGSHKEDGKVTNVWP